MITSEQLQAIIGQDAVDTDGDKIGKVGQVYLDDSTGEPAWATVNTGLFGTSESFVPLSDAAIEGDVLRVGFAKDTVKNAPTVASDGHIEPDEENDLFRYYGLTPRPAGADTDDQDAAEARSTTTTGHDTSGPTTDQAMTRSEEHLTVGTETREAGRARLRKYVVTEQESVTVPVSHEEVTIEREPITDANAGDAHDGPEISEEEHEVVLTEERPVVGTEAVAVERVRLGTETVTEQETVSGDVRKERIETDGVDVDVRDVDAVSQDRR